VRRPVKKQMGVSLDGELRGKLEASAAAKGRSIAEEIRQRLEQTIDNDLIDPATLELMAKIGKLASYTETGTRHAWHKHAGAHAILRRAISAYLAHMKPEGKPVFAEGELPQNRIFAPGSDDPDTIGLAIEAVVFHEPPMTPERRRQIDAAIEQSTRELIELHQKKESKP
jgi:plasmid stability protein